MERSICQKIDVTLSWLRQPVRPSTLEDAVGADRVTFRNTLRKMLKSGLLARDKDGRIYRPKYQGTDGAEGLGADEH
jgi:predicted transcriptional regulator